MEKKKVLDNQPWLFDKALLSLSDPVVDGVAGPKPPPCMKFCTQIHGLPLIVTSAKLSETLRGRIEKVIKVDTDRQGRIRDSFIRARIAIDISKPLRRGFFVQPGAKLDKIWCEGSMNAFLYCVSTVESSNTSGTGVISVGHRKRSH